MKIIFIHGFNSAGIGNKKVQILANYFSNGEVTKYNIDGYLCCQEEENVVCTVNLSYKPHDAISQLTRMILELCNAQREIPNDFILVGVSLGAFYAHYLSRTYGIKCVLLNPHIDPLVSLQNRIGTNKNYHTGEEYEFTYEHLRDLGYYYPNSKRDTIPDKIVPTLVCLEKGDNVLDYKKAEEFFKQSSHVIVFENGDHQFTRIDVILPEITKLEHNINY